MDAKDPQTYINRGYAYEQKNDVDKAIADFSVAIRIDPKKEEAYVARAGHYERKNQLDLALADFDAALKISPRTFGYLEARAVVRIRRGDYDGGMADLKAALALDKDDPATKFEDWRKGPLTAADIKHGEDQVRQMLRDRPTMAKFGDKTAMLQEWAARKFAGEDLHQPIFWDATEPVAADSDNGPPDNERAGRIRIRKTYIDEPMRGKKQEFERLWEDAVFELYNITNADDFNRLDREAAEGRLAKEAYVTSVVDCESRTVEKIRAFYIPEHSQIF